MQAKKTKPLQPPVIHLLSYHVFNLTEITQYHIFSALSVLSLEYRSEAHWYKAPCDLRSTKNSLEQKLMKYVWTVVEPWLNIFLIQKKQQPFFFFQTCDCSDHPKGSRVLDLYRQAGPTYSSRCTGLLQRSYSCYFLVLRDVGGTLSDILSIHQGEGPREQKVI